MAGAFIKGSTCPTRVVAIKYHSDRHIHRFLGVPSGCCHIRFFRPDRSQLTHWLKSFVQLGSGVFATGWNFSIRFASSGRGINQSETVYMNVDQSLVEGCRDTARISNSPKR